MTISNRSSKKNPINTLLVPLVLHWQPSLHSFLWVMMSCVIFWSGAKVAVSCRSERTPNNQLDSSAFATTDEYGNFTIDLPPQLHATPDLEKACTVRVLQLPADSCRLRHRTGDTYGLRLSSVEDGVRAYTAGVIRLQDSATPSDHCVGVEHMSQRRWTVETEAIGYGWWYIWLYAKRRVHVCMDFLREG